MTKSKDNRKDAKKAPMKTLKEKRVEKHLKKEIGGHSEIPTRTNRGSAH